MKKISLFILLLVSLLRGQVDKYEQINFCKLYDNVLIVKSGEVYPDQIVAVKSEKGIVIIDAGISPTLTSQYRKIIENEFPDDKIEYAINTHHHFDHTNGNQVFADATIIAQENAAAGMKQFAAEIPEFVKYRRTRYQRRDKLANTLDPSSTLHKKLKELVFMSSRMCDDLESNFRLTLPNITFTNRLEINLGNMRVKLFYFPPEFHTDNDIIAVIPELGLIFIGDILPEIDYTASITSRHDLGNAVNVLDEVIKTCGEINHVITIHAGILPSGNLISFRNKLLSMSAEKQTKISAMNKSEEVADKNKLNDISVIARNLFNNNDYYLWEGDLLNLADKLFNNEKQQEGLALFALNAELFTESVDAYDWLGDAYFKIEQFERAKAAFEKALEIYPVDSFAADMIYQIDTKLNGE